MLLIIDNILHNPIMTKLPDREQQNLVNFLRENRPAIPDPKCNLEAKLINSIGEQPRRFSKSSSSLMWTIPSAIATGVLFTSVGLNWKTPQVVIEASELDQFLVNSWIDTVDSGNFAILNQEEDTNWLFTPIEQSEKALSVSAK